MFYSNNNLQTHFWCTPLSPKGCFGSLGTRLLHSEQKIIESTRRFHAPDGALESPCSMNEFSFNAQGRSLFNGWIFIHWTRFFPMQPLEQGISWLIQLFLFRVWEFDNIILRHFQKKLPRTNNVTILQDLRNENISLTSRLVKSDYAWQALHKQRKAVSDDAVKWQNE